MAQALQFCLNRKLHSFVNHTKQAVLRFLGFGLIAEKLIIVKKWCQKMSHF
jgi:hypothetical protein